nr:TIGR03749 family integrating conjugative element protein [Salmonella enterica]
MKKHYVSAAFTALVLPSIVSADELIKWERIPLPIALKVGQERVIFADKNVRVGFPPALNGKLRVQSSGGAVYLKAESDFTQTRLQLQDVETGEMILLDVTAGANGPSEPVRIVYNQDVTSVSSSRESAERSPSADEDGEQAKRQPTKYSAPLPVLLTRYAAQSLYAPLRTVESVPGIRPVNPHLPHRLTTLYPSEPLEVTTLAAWGLGQRNVVALRLRNTAGRKVVLDPRLLQGQFVAATFQHRWLGPVGTPEDTTTLYVITAGRPEKAFISEPRLRKTAEVKKDAN